MDVGELARTAVANGADLLGVAGGDGTQALVAGIAAETTFRCWSSRPGPATTSPSTWGWTAKDPSRCLDALTDGVELRIDLGVIADRPFVNNASFGAYAAIVQSPAYRDDKRRTTTEMLPDLLVGQSGPRLVARAGNVTVEGPQAVLVSNNVYGTDDIAGLGRRARLDRGTLGMLAVTVQQRGPGGRPAAREPLAGAHQAGRPRGGHRRRRRPDPGRGRRGGAGAGHPGALHRAAARPAGPGAPRPSRGARSHPCHGLEPPVADGPDRAGQRPWMTPPVAGPGAIYGALGELDQIDQAVYRAIAATPSPSLDV